MNGLTVRHNGDCTSIDVIHDGQQVGVDLNICRPFDVDRVVRPVVAALNEKIVGWSRHPITVEEMLEAMNG